jgi:hypothetical protein
MRQMSWQNLSKKRGPAIDLSARARLGRAALEELRLQQIEERYTLGAALRALMQRIIVRPMSTRINSSGSMLPSV